MVMLPFFTIPKSNPATTHNHSKLCHNPILPQLIYFCNLGILLSMPFSILHKFKLIGLYTMTITVIPNRFLPYQYKPGIFMHIWSKPALSETREPLPVYLTGSGSLNWMPFVQYLCLKNILDK